MPSDIAGKRVLILSIGTRGDVQPFLVLASALQRAGAEPLLATLPHYTHLGREFGVRVVSILADGVKWPEPADLGDAAEDKDVFEEKLIFEPYAAHTSGMLARVRALATEHGSHVVVVGMLIWYVQWLREAAAAARPRPPPADALAVVGATLRARARARAPRTQFGAPPRNSLTRHRRATRCTRGCRRASSRCTRSPTPISSARAWTRHMSSTSSCTRRRSRSPTCRASPAPRRGSGRSRPMRRCRRSPPSSSDFCRAARRPSGLNFGSMPVRRANSAAQFGARNSDASPLRQVYSRAGWAADMLAALEAHRRRRRPRARDRQARAEACCGVARRARRTVGVARCGVAAVRVRDSPRRRGHRRRRRPRARAVARRAAPHVDRSGAMGQVDSRPRCRCVDGRTRTLRRRLHRRPSCRPPRPAAARRRRRARGCARRRRRRQPRQRLIGERAQGGGDKPAVCRSGGVPSRGGGGAAGGGV